MPTKKKKLTFPLRLTLVTTVVVSACLAIAITVGAMGVPAYNHTKKTFRYLWQSLSKEVAETATEEIVGFFKSAPITLKMIEGLVLEKTLELSTNEKTFDVCYRALKENPTFSAVYYALANGTFLGVSRETGSYIATERRILSLNKTRVTKYTISGGSWIETGTEITGYDPRSRPFWKTGMKNPNGTWTDPYRFATSKLTGYSYVLGQRGAEGILGYWAVDFEIDQLSRFLENTNIGGRGIAYILDREGAVIAQSKPKIPSRSDENAFIKQVWENFSTSNQMQAYSEATRRIFFINRFPKESQIPWYLVTMIHESDFLGPIRNTAVRSFYWGLIPCIIFVILTGMFFGRISRRLKRIAIQIDKVGNLSFDPYLHNESRIREINLMERAAERLRVGIKSFSSYAPIDLVKKLIESGRSAKLGGDEREITVLFADLAQFTSITEQKEMQAVVEILGNFLDLATKEVHKEKGIIDKFVGDCVMALWGAPDPMQDHALRACRMVLNLKKSAKGKPHMKFKCGINTGRAMVGNFGSSERMDFTAVGDSVNIAARLEKVNKTYQTQILVGPETAKAVEEEMLLREVDTVSILGRETPVRIFELICSKSESDPTTVRGVETYARALSIYRERKFSESIPLFEKARDLLGGEDTPSTLFIDSAKYFQKSPPPKDWHGGMSSENLV